MTMSGMHLQKITIAEDLIACNAHDFNPNNHLLDEPYCENPSLPQLQIILPSTAKQIDKILNDETTSIKDVETNNIFG